MSGLPPLVLQVEGGAQLLCATAAGQHLEAGAPLVLSVCGPGTQGHGHLTQDAQADTQRHTQRETQTDRDSEDARWENQSFSLPTGSPQPIRLGPDHAGLCWGSARQLALVLCADHANHSSTTHRPGRFTRLAHPNASAAGPAGNAAPLVSDGRCVAAQGTDTEEEGYGHIAEVVESSSVFTAIPLICFSFFCHATFALVYDSLDEPSRSLRTMDRISAATMALCALLYGAPH